MHRLTRHRPRPLRPGDEIFLFAPCGAVREPWRSDGIRFLENAGYHVRCGESLYLPPSPFAAGTAAARLADWRRGLATGATALLPARGGYGGVQLLDDAPFAETAAAAPLWVGGSDCTFLQTAMLQRAGLATWYGAAPCGQLADIGEGVARKAFLDAIAGHEGTTIALPGTQILRDGRAEGELRGGCLSIIASLAGTPDQLDARDAIVILEDTGEHPFRIERMLRQLIRSGSLAGARGLLFNTFPGCTDRSGSPALVAGVIRNVVDELGLPAWIDCPLGHGPDIRPVPLGTVVRMGEDRLELLESPWRSPR